MRALSEPILRCPFRVLPSRTSPARAPVPALRGTPLMRVLAYCVCSSPLISSPTRFGTPIVGLAIYTTLVVFFILVLGDMETIIAWEMVSYCVAQVLEFAAFIKLRYKYGTFSSLLDHLSRSTPPTRAVEYALLCAHADRALKCAGNPILCPIHGARPGTRT